MTRSSTHRSFPISNRASVIPVLFWRARRISLLLGTYPGPPMRMAFSKKLHAESAVCSIRLCIAAGKTHYLAESITYTLLEWSITLAIIGSSHSWAIIQAILGLNTKPLLTPAGQMLPGTLPRCTVGSSGPREGLLTMLGRAPEGREERVRRWDMLLSPCA